MIRIKKAADGEPTAERRARNDIALIAILLSLAALAALALFLLRAEGDSVTVTVDGRFFGEYPLGEDRVVEITNGDHRNLLVIEGGRAYVREASCPDGICASHRPIQYNGESIICLPNRVVIDVHTEDHSRPDIIA